jgi:hypothetical protein
MRGRRAERERRSWKGRKGKTREVKTKVGGGGGESLGLSFFLPTRCFTCDTVLSVFFFAFFILPLFILCE